MTNEEIEKEKKNIDKMTHYELAHLWRHSYLGHPYFQNKDLNNYYIKAFNKFGGMTSEISKQIGW